MIGAGVGQNIDPVGVLLFAIAHGYQHVPGSGTAIGFAFDQHPPIIAAIPPTAQPQWARQAPPEPVPL